MLVYTGALYHGGGPNRSDAPCARREHHVLRRLVAPGGEPVPLGAARGGGELPDELLRMIGYDRGAYALGYVDDLRDPIEAIRPGAGAIGFGNTDAETAAARAFGEDAVRAATGDA